MKFNSDRVQGMRCAMFASLIVALALCWPQSPLLAQEFTVTIKDHRFEPKELRIPANKRVTIYVVNDDPTPEEFESTTMKFEKIIPGKSKGLVRVGPLAPGRYEFFGEFNPATAQGVVIAE
jgi:Cupredoxin-like domain